MSLLVAGTTYLSYKRSFGDLFFSSGVINPRKQFSVLGLGMKLGLGGVLQQGLLLLRLALNF